MLAELDPRYLLSIFLRRFPVFLLTAVLIFAGFATAAVLLPASYTSSAKILVESQQIPGDLVMSTVRSHAAERLKVIEQRIMTRDNLLEIAEDFDVFADRRDLSPTEIVTEMRESSQFRLARLGGGRGSGTMALAFTVSFSTENPRVAAKVVGEYVTRILESNVRLRTERAADTYEFFEQEVQRLGGELTAVEAEMVEFKRANRQTLPETLDFRSNNLFRVQQRVQLIDREVANLRERRKTLLSRRENPDELLAGERDPTLAELQHAELQRRLGVRMAILSDEHPEIKNLKTQIATLERIMADEERSRRENAAEVMGEQLSRELSSIDDDIELIDQQLDQLMDEMTSLETREASLERTIAETPNTQMQLKYLQRNYANLQRQYEEARSKLALSATGEQLELKQQAERFELIEEATVPEEPDKPDRMMILLMGVGGGGGAGLGLIVLLEFLNRAVRRPSDVVAVLDMQPLAVIPYIYTEPELRRRSRMKWGFLVALLAALCVFVALVHLYYLPLDLLFRQLLEKTELDSVLEMVRSRLGL